MIVVVRNSAKKDFKKIQEPYKSKIRGKIILLQEFPNIVNIKKLVNFIPAYRLRVGDYRILFDIEENKVIISRILHRQSSYK